MLCASVDDEQVFVAPSILDGEDGEVRLELTGAGCRRKLRLGRSRVRSDRSCGNLLGIPRPRLASRAGNTHSSMSFPPPFIASLYLPQSKVDPRGGDNKTNTQVPQNKIKKSNASSPPAT